MKQGSLTEPSAAAMLSALGSPVRLRVFRALVRAGDDGLNVTELQREVGIPPSTLAHHLSTLVEAGLVAQQRRGRELICTAHYAQLRRLGDYLVAECCTGARGAGRRAA